MSPPKYRFAVTGAAGFIGRRLVYHLQESGYDVTAVVRNIEQKEAFEKTGINVRIADVRDKDSLIEAFENIDGVFHCAALFNHPDRTWDDYRDANVKGTVNVLDSARKQGVHRVIHCSTVGVATEAEPPPYSEDTPYSPQPGDKYEVTKCEGEIAALKYAKDNKTSLCVIRPAQVYGPGDTSKAKFYKMVKKGIIVRPGETSKHLIYIDDLCHAFHLAMITDEADGEIFLIAGAQPIKLRELITIAAEKLAVPYPRVQLPATPVTFACGLVERISNLVGIRPVVHKRSMDFFTRTVECNTSRSQSILDFHNRTTVSDGVSKTVDWLTQNGHL